MKYLAICILSLVVHVTSQGASRDDAIANAHTPPALQDIADTATATAGAPTDGALAALLGGALIALQLRRRQKSLRMPRPLHFR